MPLDNAAENRVTMSAQTSRNGGGPSMMLDFEKPIIKMEEEIQRLEASQATSGRDFSDVISRIREQLDAALREAYGKLSAWEKVLVARHPRRPLLRDYLQLIAKDFCELHGDKLYGNDRALVTGFARLPLPNGKLERVMVVGHHKGRDTREKIDTNFGCAHPEGYRKALQKMQLAAKFRVPVVCLIDTPGAYPGVGAEERGIARAIAVNLMELSRLGTPIVAAVIGEGGSGGALGVGIADRVAVMEHAYYSVITPEGGAAIMWKSAEHAPKAADALKLTTDHLLKLSLIDGVIPEPLGGAHRNHAEAATNLAQWIGESLVQVRRTKLDTLLKKRYERLRKLGSFFESTQVKTKRATVAAEAAGATAPVEAT